MNLIFEYQISIFEDLFYTYLNPKQCIKLYSSNKILYNIYHKYNKFDNYYFIPKNQQELRIAISYWFTDNINALKQYGHISNWDVSYKIHINYNINTTMWFDYKELFNEVEVETEEWNTNRIINRLCMF